MDSKTDSARGGSLSPEAVSVRDSLRTEFDKINRSDKTGYEKSEAKNIYIAILESEGLDPPVLFNLLTNLGLEYTKGLEDKIEALSHDHKPQGGASVSGGGGRGSSLSAEAPRGAEETSVSGGGGGENDSFKEEQLITINGLPQLFTDINLDTMKVDGKSIPSSQRAKSIANQSSWETVNYS